MNILKAVGAILAGLVFIVITHTVTDFILESLGILPPPSAGLHVTWMLALALFYRTIFTIAGGYLTALIAPEPKMRYVLILGMIGTLLGALGVAMNAQLNLGPMWYPVALAALAIPSVWLGGKLRTK